MFHLLKSLFNEEWATCLYICIHLFHISNKLRITGIWINSLHIYVCGYTFSFLVRRLDNLRRVICISDHTHLNTNNANLTKTKQSIDCVQSLNFNVHLKFFANRVFPCIFFTIYLTWVIRDPDSLSTSIFFYVCLSFLNGHSHHFHSCYNSSKSLLSTKWKENAFGLQTLEDEV